MRTALLALAAAAGLGGCTYATCELEGRPGEACWVCGYFEEDCTARTPDGVCQASLCEPPSPPPGRPAVASPAAAPADADVTAPASRPAAPPP